MSAPEPMSNEEIAELGGLAAAKVMNMADPCTGATRVSTLDVVAMAGLIDMLGLSRPDLLPKRRTATTKPKKGGL